MTAGGANDEGTEDTPRPITEVIPETPLWLCAIITKLHAKNPDERYQTAQEVVDVLADCESQLKEHSRLRDLSLIPRPKTRPTGWWKVAAALVLVAPMLLFSLDWLRHWSVEDDGKVEETKAVETSIPESIQAEPINPVATATAEQGTEQVIPTPPSAIAPFDAAQAKAHQEAWAKHLGVPVEYANSIGMKFRLIPPGEFTMGTSPEDAAELIKNVTDWAKDWVLSETPARKVRITEPFYLGTTEVTVGQFKQFVAAKDYKTHAETNGRGGDAYSDKGFVTGPEFTWRHPDLTQSDAHPVGQLCPEDANAFCNWLQKLDGRVYQLPDEEQWEYACRAGTVTPWSFGTGDELATLHGLTGWNLLFTGRAVAQSPANPFGLFDVHGNFEEMCHSQHEAYIDRGGSSALVPLLARSASRGTPIDRLRSYFQQGFRVAVVGNLKPSGSPAKQEPLPPTFKNALGMEFVIVPKGKSWLGGGKDKLGDKEVEIPADFWLGKHEVTQEQWRTIMDTDPSHFSRSAPGAELVQQLSDAELNRLPVEGVSWDDCEEFLRRLNRLEKESGWVYRLPSASQWEYACRGGRIAQRSDSAFDFYLADATNDLTEDAANFNDKLKRTCKVGSYPPNRLGLCDMHGNVWEWCDDAVGDGSERATRGGCWTTTSSFCQAGLSFAALASQRAPLRGLRVARVPADSSKALTGDMLRFNSIAALSAAEQVEEVRKELVRLNPTFNGKLQPTIENGVVMELSFNSDDIANIAPVRALKGLVYLDCRGTYPNKGKLSDLSPLEGMTLSRLDCSSTQISDLNPLIGMPLTVLQINHNPVSDLAPLKGMHLEKLGCAETKVADLSPLKGMKIKVLGAQLLPVTDLSPLEGMPLTGLDLYHTVGVTNLQPLKGMPLEGLNLQDVPVSDLSPLKGMMTLRTLHLQKSQVLDLSPLAGLKLTDLLLQDQQITDLSPLAGLPLTRLVIYNTGASDLRPLAGMPLHVIRLNPKNITQGIEVLREMKSLKSIGINDNKAWPAAEFWERYDKKEFALAPFTEADLQRIAALPAVEQVEEVRKELMNRNPAFDGKVEHKIEDGVVTELKLITDEVIDISPLRALQRLVSLKLGATAQPGKRSKLSDISPLRGLPLTHLDLSCTAVTNIEVLKEMPLKDLSLDRVPVADLSSLTGKVFKSLHFGGTKVKSLSDVPIASSEVIHCHLPQITDKADLQRWGVRFLDLWGVPTTTDPERLLELKPPLSRVNGKPLEEFLKETP